jgi:hypothetical protein
LFVVALLLAPSAFADTRSGQGSKASDQPPALDGGFVGDLGQVRVVYDTTGTLTATVRFYQPIPAEAWSYYLEVRVGEGANCATVVTAGEAVGTITPNPFPGQEFWVEVAGYQGGVTVPQTISADGRETSFTFSNPAISNRDLRCASADVLLNYAPHDLLPSFWFDGFAPAPPPPPLPPAPAPSPVKLSASKLQLSKATPGQLFSVSTVITNASTGQGAQGTVSCAASLGGKQLSGARHTSSASGKATCAWRLQKNARGKQLRGTISATYHRARVSRRFSVRVS